MRAQRTVRKLTIASATAGLLALAAGPSVADAATPEGVLGGCPANASVHISHTQSGGDSLYSATGTVTTLSNCRAEAFVLLTPEVSGDTPSAFVLDSRTPQELDGGGFANLYDGYGVTFWIVSYSLGGDVTYRSAACTAPVGGSCSV